MGRKLQMTIMVAEVGFEPTTSRLWASRATTAPLCRMPAPRLQGGCEREVMQTSVSSCIFTMPSYHRPYMNFYVLFERIFSTAFSALPCRFIVHRHDFPTCTATSSHVLSLT